MLRLSSLAHKLLMFMFMPMLASQVRTGKYQNDKCMFLLLFKSSMIKNSSTDFLASPVKGLELNRRSPIQALLVRDVSNQVSISWSINIIHLRHSVHLQLRHIHHQVSPEWNNNNNNNNNKNTSSTISILHCNIITCSAFPSVSLLPPRFLYTAWILNQWNKYIIYNCFDAVSRFSISWTMFFWLPVVIECGASEICV